MANAVFYRTAKRHNSTLQPSGSGTTIDVQLKNGSDIIAPVFLMSLPTMPDYSMMVFEGRTYFIIGITSVRENLWEIAAAVDVLATYKSNILGTTAFVLYDSAANTEIVDSRLPAIKTAVTQRNIAALDPGIMTGSGTLAVSVVGQNTTSTFLLSAGQLRELVNSTNLNTFLANTFQPIDDQISGNLLSDVVDSFMSLVKGIKALIARLVTGQNLMSCIRSVIWYPWQLYGDGANQEIYLGQMPTGVSSAPVVNPIEVLDTVTVEIPWQASDWRRMAPYHNIYLYIPFIGSIHLSNSDIASASSLTLLPAINKHNGAFSVQVSTNTGQLIGVYGSNTGISIPVGASNISPNQLVNSIMQEGAAVAAGAAGNIGLAASMALSSLSSLSPTITSIGGGSGGAGSGLDRTVHCTSVFHDTNVGPNTMAATIGMPTMAQQSLSGKTGYVRTLGASVSGSMTDTERNMINQLLDGGVYIE
jgi:hypothetical protein